LNVQKNVTGKINLNRTTLDFLAGLRNWNRKIRLELLTQT
jgi:hypothetical protein